MQKILVIEIVADTPEHIAKELEEAAWECRNNAWEDTDSHFGGSNKDGNVLTRATKGVIDIAKRKDMHPVIRRE